MSRRRRLTALAVLHLLVLGLGVGVATARDAQPAAAATAPAYVPPPSFAPEAPVAKPRVVKPRPKPRPQVTHAPSPRATHRAVHRTTRRTTQRASTPTPVPTHKAASTLSFKDRMMRAVARIPGYHAGEAEWIVKPDLSNWGMAVMGGSTVYISPKVPADRLYDVVAHEWSHLLMVKDYGGDTLTAIAAANSYFGGSDLVGSERAADCMAKLLGATWTHYTSCSNASWRAGAQRLVARQRL